MPKTNSWGSRGNPPYGSWGPLFADRNRTMLTMGDPELAAKIQARIGERYAPAVDLSKLNITEDEMAGLGGAYLPTELGDLVKVDPLARRVSNDRPKLDNVYVTPNNFNVDTTSHEFRHRYGIHDEGANRILDGFYANSPEAWEGSVVQFIDHFSQYYDNWTQIPRQAWEAYFVDRLLSEDYFGEKIRAEDYREKKGKGKKFFKGMFDSSYSTNYDKALSPWKIWAQQKGWLDKNLKPTDKQKALVKQFFEQRAGNAKKARPGQ